MKNLSDDIKSPYGKSMQKEAHLIIEIFSSIFNCQELAKIKLIWTNLCILLKTEFFSVEIDETLEKLQEIILSNKGLPEIKLSDKEEEDIIHLGEGS